MTMTTRGSALLEYVFILVLVTLPVVLALGVFETPGAQIGAADGKVAPPIQQLYNPP